MMPARSINAAVVVSIILAGCAAPALAQSPSAAEPPAPAAPPPDAAPSLGRVLVGAAENFKALPSVDTLQWLTIGGLAALAAHPADRDATSVLAGDGALNEPFKAGAVLGGTPFELGAAFATYGIGRALHNARTARLGADLVQTELMAEVITFGVKQTVRRARPSGSGYSFPSGHAAVTFSSAAVLQRHFGWRVGIPAYAAAAYVAASRIQTERHYLSDVVFGAALGTVVAHTVNRGQRFAVTPVMTPNEKAVMFGWMTR